MIYTVTLNPALDKTVEITDFAVDRVNRISALRTDPGGKGINVSKVLQELGVESVVFALLGGTTGQKIAQDLEALGLQCRLTFAEGETRTNLKVIDRINHTNTDINEPGLEVTPQVLAAMQAELCSLVQEGDIVVFSGSLPQGAAPDTYECWARSCAAAGAKVFLDADGPLLAAGMQAKPYLVKPNDEELSRWMGRELTTVEELCDAGKSLLKRGAERVVVSMGSRGALYLTEDTCLYAEGLKVPVGSTVGAGDSVVAALAVAEARGLTWEEAARLSTATGAANVMCDGSQAAPQRVIEELMPQVVIRRL